VELILLYSYLICVRYCYTK